MLEGLVSGWEEERRVARTVSQAPPRARRARPYLKKFFFSSYQLLTTQISPVSKALSPPAPLPSSLSSANLSSLPSAASSLLNTYSAARRAGPAPVVPSPFAEEDTGPDPREIDKVLVELTAMAGRWGLYRRFLWGRLQVRHDVVMLTAGSGCYIDPFPSFRDRKSRLPHRREVRSRLLEASSPKRASQPKRTPLI